MVSIEDNSTSSQHLHTPSSLSHSYILCVPCYSGKKTQFKLLPQWDKMVTIIVASSPVIYFGTTKTLYVNLMEFNFTYDFMWHVNSKFPVGWNYRQNCLQRPALVESESGLCKVVACVDRFFLQKPFLVNGEIGLRRIIHMDTLIIAHYPIHSAFIF